MGRKSRASRPVPDVVEFIDYLGADDVVLVAHSFGSLEAVEVATRHPERVSALVLMDAVYDWPTWASQTAHLSAVDPPDSALESRSELEAWYREVQAPTWGIARRMSLRAKYSESGKPRLNGSEHPPPAPG